MRRLGILACVALAGCTTSGVPVSRQVVVSGGNFQAVQGEAQFFVRAFLPPEGDQRREVLGARCDVVSSLYAAEVVTPSRVVVPNFGPQSPEITVTCRADHASGSSHMRIITRWQPAPGFYGDPFWGPGWGPGWGGPWGPWGGWGPSYPISSYPDIEVTLTAAPPR